MNKDYNFINPDNSDSYNDSGLLKLREKIIVNLIDPGQTNIETTTAYIKDKVTMEISYPNKELTNTTSYSNSNLSIVEDNTKSKLNNHVLPQYYNKHVANQKNILSLKNKSFLTNIAKININENEDRTSNNLYKRKASKVNSDIKTTEGAYRKVPLKLYPKKYSQIIDANNIDPYNISSNTNQNNLSFQNKVNIASIINYGNINNNLTLLHTVKSTSPLKDKKHSIKFYNDTYKKDSENMNFIINNVVKKINNLNILSNNSKNKNKTNNNYSNNGKYHVQEESENLKVNKNHDPKTKNNISKNYENKNFRNKDKLKINNLAKERYKQNSSGSSKKSKNIDNSNNIELPNSKNTSLINFQINKNINRMPLPSMVNSRIKIQSKNKKKLIKLNLNKPLFSTDRVNTDTSIINCHLNNDDNSRCYIKINNSIINLKGSTNNNSFSKKERRISENKNFSKVGNQLIYVPIVKTDLCYRHDLNISRNIDMINKTLQKSSTAKVNKSVSRTNLKEARLRKYSANSNCSDESLESNLCPIVNNKFTKFETILKKLDEIKLSFIKNKALEEVNNTNEPNKDLASDRNFIPKSKNYLNFNNLFSEKQIKKNFLTPISNKNQKKNLKELHADVYIANCNNENNNFSSVKNINEEAPNIFVKDKNLNTNNAFTQDQR